jgi:hypothetical protein
LVKSILRNLQAGTVGLDAYATDVGVGESVILWG